VRALRGLALALFLAACAPATPSLPPSPIAAGSGIVIVAEPVPLDPAHPGHKSLGAFTYAGGLALTSEQTSRLHGLSDLEVWPDGRVLAVGDQGDLLEARLVLDHAGGPGGLADARLTSIVGEDGQPITSLGDREYDAEGIAEFPNGDRLISLEQHDRIYFYPHAGGPPRLAPMPAVTFVFNKGMEGLDLSPAAGADAYVVGIEASGETYLCRLSAACVKDRTVALGDGYELSALATLPGGRMAYLLRAFDPLKGNRNILRIVDAQGAVLDELKLGKPLTVDNFEGLAVAPSPNGGQRFYLLSDDNFRKTQRTLLVAFDWRPGA
jgi:hypothetical protein